MISRGEKGGREGEGSRESARDETEGNRESVQRGPTGHARVKSSREKDKGRKA